MLKFAFKSSSGTPRLTKASLPAMLGVALLAATAWPAAWTSRAEASDLDISATDTYADEVQMLRLVQGKSAVVKLPVSVKDVIVGNQATLDVVIKNKHTAYLFGIAAGQTNVFFFDANGQQILQLDVDIIRDVKPLQKLIERTIPGSNVTLDTTGANVVLNGTVNNAAEAKMAEDLVIKSGIAAEAVVNALQVTQGDQVMLKVKVVEVQRDVLKRLGVQLSGAFNIGDLAAGFGFNNLLGGGSGGGAGFDNGDVRLDATVRAMEENGLVRTLAEPNLTAVSGQPAQFLAGGQYPYIVRNCDSNRCYDTVTYKDYGVKLGFTPTVLNEGRISLKIATEVSELSGVAAGALNTRAAETTIELPSGGAMMLAGLIKDSTAQSIKGTPGLKDLPVLGSLFRSREYISGQTELAVIVVPFLVKPVAENELATPADRLGTPTDRQAILLGRLNKVYGAPGKKPNGVYHGNVGYIIE